MKKVFELTDTAFPIRLDMLSKNHFRVTYGLQIDNNLTYAEACMKLGQAIMHSLNCDGKMD